jgi:hypothetical protein
MLLAEEDAAPDCVTAEGPDAGLLAGGDCARTGVAEQNVATIKRYLIIECPLRAPLLDSQARSSEPKYLPKIDDGERLWRRLLAKIPVSSGASSEPT